MKNSCNFNYFDLLERNAKLYRRSPALIGDFGIISHEALLARSLELARSLYYLDIRLGDRIALLAPNVPRTLELLAAAGRCGAILILLNTRSSASEIETIIADSGARHVFVDVSLESLIAGLPDERVTCYALMGATEKLQAYPAPDAACIPQWPIIEASLPLVGIPTAAVQGRPRIALLSHAALMHQAFQLSAHWSLNTQDRHLCILPLFHTAGLSLSIAVQLVGGAIVLIKGFDAAAAVDAVEEHNASFFSSFAPILNTVLDAADARGAALSSLRIVTGLEPQQAVGRLVRRCPHVRFWHGYGQTETGGIVTLGVVGDHVGSAGRPLAEVGLRIATESGADAGVDKIGEILVRGPGIFSGYWQLPAVNAHVAREGWHHTGDLGHIDADGYLWYEGRTAEKIMIKSGGENIYPVEVEQALLGHPAVAQARVVGVPDEKWGETVRAFCVLRAGSQVGEQELIDFVGTRIARFKRPKEVLFVESLSGELNNESEKP